jgi:uncharacterized membrane protein
MEKSNQMTQKKFGEKDFQKIVGNLLRYGVWISLSVAFIGGIVYLLYHGNDIENYSVFKENDQNIFEVIAAIYNGLMQGRGESIIFFGIILLFLTPVFVRSNHYNRDRNYHYEYLIWVFSLDLYFYATD